MVRDSRGIISYHYASSSPQARPAPPADSPSPQEVRRKRWELANAANRQRRQDELDYQDTRRQLDDLRRQRQQEEDAYQAAWRQNRRAQRWQEQEQSRTYEQQVSQWSENQRQRAAAESAQLQQASQALDAVLISSQRQWDQQQEWLRPKHKYGQ
jgi:hypothetical protein